MVVADARPSAGLDDARVVGRAGDAPDVPHRPGRREQAHGAAVERRRHARPASRSSPRCAERDVVRADGHRHVSPHDAAVEAVHAAPTRPCRSPRRRGSRGTRRAAAPSRRAARSSGARARRARRPRPLGARARRHPDVLAPRRPGHVVREERRLDRPDEPWAPRGLRDVENGDVRRPSCRARPRGAGRPRSARGVVPGREHAPVRRSDAGRDRPPRRRPRFDSLT